MSELTMLTELKELTKQKSPNQNKQRALVKRRLPQAGRADSGGVGTVTKSSIHINAKAFLLRFGFVTTAAPCGIAYQSGSHIPSGHLKGWLLRGNPREMLTKMNITNN